MGILQSSGKTLHCMQSGKYVLPLDIGLQPWVAFHFTGSFPPCMVPELRKLLPRQLHCLAQP